MLIIRRRLSTVTLAKEYTQGSKVTAWISTRVRARHRADTQIVRRQDAFKVVAGAAPGAPGPQQVVLGLVASPVWDDDVQALRGQSTAVGSTPGRTGLFKVDKVGKDVKRFAVGDLAMPYKAGFGTWRAHAVAAESDLVKVPAKLNSASAAVDLIAHATAIRLLDGLKKGDVVGCAGAQGPLGLALTVVGKAMGLRVVCINGPAVDPAKGMKKLKDAGAELVVPHEWSSGTSYTASYKFRRLVDDLPPAKLVVNIAGGSLAQDALRLLDGGGGELVTLGGAPFVVPASFFTQRLAVARGFNLAAWLKNAKLDEVQDLCDRAAQSVAATQAEFTSPVSAFALDEASTAVDAEGFGPTPVLQVEVKRPFAQPVVETKLAKAFKANA